MNKKIKFGVYVGVTAVCLVLLILTVISSITLLSEKLVEGNMGRVLRTMTMTFTTANMTP